MSLSKDLLQILCCPESHQPLRELTRDEIQLVNRTLKSKKLKSVAGKTIEVEIDGGLLREDAEILYPIRQGIPVLLVDEGVVVDKDLEL